jgi:energy-coupling factor transporter ATP-binding protein EcfA2
VAVTPPPVSAAPAHAASIAGTAEAGPDGAPGLAVGPRLLDILGDVLEQVESAPLEIDVPGADEARALRLQVATQLRTRLLPRLREVDHPAVIVVGGSTGAGKSTLVNSLLGSEVSEAGVLRPTTREPILAVHPREAARMSAHPVATVATVTPRSSVPRGIALLDTPDVDSLDDQNRALGARLIESADLWLFVTTAARYGDAIPWAILQTAHQRGVTVAIVLNRVRESALTEIRRDLDSRLMASGLGGAPLFVLPDLGPHEGLIPGQHLVELAGWLSLLADKTRAASIVARTVRSSWPTLRSDVAVVAHAVDAQAVAVRELEARARRAVEPEAALAAAQFSGGGAARGGPTARWRAQAAKGLPLAPLAADSGRRWVRSRGGAARARAAAVAGLRAEVVSTAQALLVDAGLRADRGVRSAWVARGRAGVGLAVKVDTSASARARADRAHASLESWSAAVERDVESWLPSRSSLARRLLDARGWAGLVCAAAVGVDGAARAVDRFLGERGTAAWTTARRDLAERTAAAVRAEADPFIQVLTGLDIGDNPAERLRAGVRELEVVS